MTFYDFQMDAISKAEEYTSVALYHPMGSGKTYTGAEIMSRYGESTNIIICQKSKVEDWFDHIKTNYPNFEVFNLTDASDFDRFFNSDKPKVGIINYDIIFLRKKLLTLSDFTLVLDESSVIQNETTKRCKTVMKMKFSHIILLSGTPVGGKYERLWSQMFLVGWGISKKTFYNQFVDFHYADFNGFPQMVVDGYKHTERMKRKMREHGCQFLTQEEVLPFLPDTIEQKIRVKKSKDYDEFNRTSIIDIDGETLVGDHALVRLLRLRQLAGMYSKEKQDAFRDLLESADDRLIVFYNFVDEKNKLIEIAKDYTHHISVIDGATKDRTEFDEHEDSIIFIQYQSGSMGLNLQASNKIIYFSPPQSSELFEQSKKRIHRIGQERPCYYYYLICEDTIEEWIYKTLKERRVLTANLFKEVDGFDYKRLNRNR